MAITSQLTKLNRFLSNPFKAFLLIFLAGFSLYAISLKGEFIFDDYAVLDQARQFRPNLKNIVFESRSLSYLSFKINYFFYGRSPFSYHFINVLIHVFNGLLVYLLVQNALNIKSYKKKRLINISAFLGAILFLIHPVQTQAVSYISQRMEILAALFYLSSLYFYARARLEKNNTYYILLAFSSLLASLSKETSLTLPLAIFGYDLFFISKSPLKLFKKPYWLIPLVIIFGRYFGVVMMPELLAKKPEPVSLTEVVVQESQATFEREGITRENYLLTQIHVIPKYILLLFAPLGLRLDYDFPLVTGFSVYPTLFYLLFLSAIVFLALFFHKKFRFASYGIIFFFLALLPSSSIFPIDDLIFEHRLYLPLLGLVFALAEFLTRLKTKKAIKLGCGFILVWFSFLTILSLHRNYLWSDKFKFWEDNYRKEPEKARVAKNYGVQLVVKGRLEEGLKLINFAIQKEPDQPEYYLALAKIYEANREYQKAEKEYQRVLDFCKGVYLECSISNFYSLGVVQFKQGKTEEAIASFNQVLKLDNKHAPSYIGLCSAYELGKDYQKAIESCKKALDIEKNINQAYQKLARLYSLIGDIPKAGYYQNKIKK